MMCARACVWRVRVACSCGATAPVAAYDACRDWLLTQCEGKSRLILAATSTGLPNGCFLCVHVTFVRVCFVDAAW